MASRLVVNALGIALVVCLLVPKVAQAAEQVWVVAEGKRDDALENSARQGVSGNFRVSADVRLSASESDSLWRSARTQKPLDARVHKALTAAKVRAVVLVMLQKASKKALRVQVTVVDVANNQVAEPLRTAAGKISRGVARPNLKGVASLVRSALAKLPNKSATPAQMAKASSSQGEEPAEEIESLEMIEAIEPIETLGSVEMVQAKTLPRRVAKRDADAQYIVRLGSGAGMRSFSYAQPLSGGLREYQVGARWTLHAGVKAMPLQWRSTYGSMRSLGVEVDYFMAPSFNSRVGDSSDTLATSWSEWRVGPAMRLELLPFVLDLSASYGALNFGFASNNAELEEQLPAMAYRYLRLGFDTEFAALDWLYLHAGMGLRLLFQSGPTTEARFPNAQQAAVDVNLGASIPIAGALRLLTTLAYTHVYFDFKPQPGDARVAGGALDMYLALNVGALYAF